MSAPLFAPQVKLVHRALSPYSLAFLEYVERHPEALERARYRSLERPRSSLFPYTLQPWPTYADAETTRSLERAITGLAALVHSLPERVFEDDAERICEYFGIRAEGARVLERVLADPRLRSGSVMRGDFCFADGGLRCLELNVSANLGGLFTGVWFEAYAEVDVLRGFLDEAGVAARCLDPLREIYRYIVGRALEAGRGAGGELNLGFATRGLRLGETSTMEHIRNEYRRVLASFDPGLEGELLITDYPEIERGPGGLTTGGRRIDALIEHYSGYLVRPVLEAWLAGEVDVYAGPMARILGDKRALALLSELADSGLFSHEEAALIDELVPWTRLLADGYVTFRGERRPLEDLLFERRERMVIKPAQGCGGEGVYVGLFTPREEWLEAVRSGIAAGDRIVQEFVAFRPLIAQLGEAGCAPHDFNWGLFCFGSRFGGSFLRAVPTGDHGVVNARRGATETIVIEVGPAAETAASDADPLIRSYRPEGGPEAAVRGVKCVSSCSC